MAALNFPNTPALNDVYTANGTTWKWDGESWVSISTATGALKSIQATFPGTLATLTGSVRYYPQSTITLTNVFVSMGTAPSAGGAVFNIRKNGTSIFTSPKPTVASAANSSTPLTISVAVTPTDYLTVDVETASGADAVVRIDYA